jgi:hypothetical protein
MSSAATSRTAAFYTATALSLSLGWGIRGNFGHEYGAMIPGALASMAAVLLSGRDDWHARIASFAFFGALGWSFGGSISYMQVIGYTHSGHSLSVLYGFACLFVIGFLWAALGGAGTALPAVVGESFLKDMLLPLGIVLLFWWLQGIVVEPALRHLGYSLDWYDTDWLAAALALLGGLLIWLARRRLDRATSLVLHLAGGWWVGFTLLVLLLGLRMTPPRGDNWSGCLGMTGGLFWYCRRAGMPEVARAGIVCGFIGGIGFAAASMLKLVEITSGYQTNWHSILEQTTGLFCGIGLAVAIAELAARTPELASREPGSQGIEPVALCFVLLGITYINLRKNVARWVSVRAMPREMAGIPAWVWFDIGYVLLAFAFLVLLLRHRRRRLPIAPESWVGKGQLLYLGLLWWVVVGNFERALVAFSAERLVTEGVIFAVALFCTLILVLAPESKDGTPAEQLSPRVAHLPEGMAATAVVGLAGALFSILIDWAIVRAVYGDRFAGHAGRHIRFGPNATINRPENR